MIPPFLSAAHFVALNGKKPCRTGWPVAPIPIDEVQPILARGGNIGIRVGPASGDIVDGDLDCPEALKLADLYLPPTGAEFGRASKPRSHRLYRSPDAVYASFSDPTDGSQLIEFRADGREGGAHQTTIPPSVHPSDELYEWDGEPFDPASVDAAVLARRMAWLAIGCLVLRYVSEYAARDPKPDLPSLLWEADPKLGRAAYRWIGERAPDEARSLKPRRLMTRAEIDLAELVASIPNNFDWTGWNRVGMAVYAASGGSEEGFVAFDDLSSRSPKYDPCAAQERWRNYRRSPPNRIGIGTLVYLAPGRRAA